MISTNERKPTMKKLLTSVAFISLFAGSVFAAPATSKDFNTYRFVGFSSQVVAANQSRYRMHEDCQADHGVDARMCTEQEVLNSSTITNVPLSSQTGWIEPTLFINPNGLSNGTFILDPFTSNNRNCAGWATALSTQKGATVNARGAFKDNTCDNSYFVACCIPLEQ